MTAQEAITKLTNIMHDNHVRVFKEIVVEYPTYNTYPEYKGKPYFSIKYTENGQEFIGYGSYKPEVLSKYLKEYFLPSAQPETHGKRTETHACDCISRQAAIRWVKTECNPYGKPTLDFESGKKVIEHLKQLPSAQPEPCDDPRADIYYLAEKIGIHRLYALVVELRGEPEQRWISCGKCIHADGKHRWCKVLDRTINEDYFCCWAEPRKEGEAK